MATTIAWLVTVLVAFQGYNFAEAQTEDYRQCHGPYNAPEIITSPQLIKIEAPPTNVYTGCYMQFRAAAGQFVELNFIELDIRSLDMPYNHVNACISDGNHAYVEVKQSYLRVGQRLCGQTNQLPAQEKLRRSTTNHLELDFSNNVGKFQVEFSIVSSPGGQVCPNSVVELSGSGTIRFPNDDITHVLNNNVCSWRITASVGKRVKLTMKYSQIGQNAPFRFSACHPISLNVYDSNTATWPPMQQYCYGIIGRNVTELISSGRNMFLQFSTWRFYIGSRFEADYEEI